MKKTKQVIVVDDDPIIRSLLTDALTVGGYSVIEAENGKEALRMIKEFCLDLIISDTNMPVMDGTELCKEIKSNIELNKIPFILMSSDMQSVKNLGLEIKADYFLEKPFTLQKFLSVISFLINSKV
jgi:CheY-like chemotaxis protein